MLPVSNTFILIGENLVTVKHEISSGSNTQSTSDDSLSNLTRDGNFAFAVNDCCIIVSVTPGLIWQAYLSTIIMVSKSSSNLHPIRR